MEIAKNKWGEWIIWLPKILVVVFFVTGAVMLFKAIFKTVVFDQYPLPEYSVCKSVSVDDKKTTCTEEETKDSRKIQMLEDYTGAASLLLLGAGLTWLVRGKKE
ncbi:MAG: hypothetical protein CEN89_15 [Candidatus Berkelbacteria bacterium Licking1014_7]|uniref:Uncharacterized protein n=1 Tax=Candidatus Berkelbacteria bacterium Licking1014_7 TaxID=2017147 RepID=A0A554LKT5_9BACT|nr:MAG: hypothetical protein CEN89_15 [Candidatus Berkelbacteria bacterium Licking1014_7]